MKKIIVLLLISFSSMVCAESELMLKNKARRFCRKDPEKCTPAYIMEKFPGSRISKGGNGNCVNIDISNVKTTGRERKVEQNVVMGDLTVICD